MANLRLKPLAWVAIAAAFSVVVRFIAALEVRAPVFYPDDYLTVDVARAVTDGRFGSIRGGEVTSTFTSYVVPILQAPLWLLEDVNTSVRLSQALAAVAFAAAAFAAYALSRRVGVGGQGSLVVAVLTLLAPAGALTATLLTEPYAFPLFLLAVLLAVDAIAAPTLWRHLAVLGMSIGLCFVGGLQFLYFAAAYVLAWALSAFPSTTAVVRRFAFIGGASAAALALMHATGQREYLDVLLSALRAQDYPLDSTGAWFVVNAFVLAIAAGWVILPGAVVGLRALGRSASPPRRAFALFTALVLIAMLVEAALWGVNDQGVYERFTFYGAPLLAIAFVWAAEQASPGRRTYAVVAYLGALAAAVLPVTEPLIAAIDVHSPTINGLSELTLGADIGGGIWAPVLVLLALGVAWRGMSNPRTVIVVAACICAFASLGESLVLVRVTEDRKVTPQIATEAGSALVTWQGADPFLQLDALFWTPEITRVVLVGRGVSPDLLPFVRTRLASPGELVADDESRVAGPFVVGPDVVGSGDAFANGDPRRFVTFTDVPPLLGFGFRRLTGDMGTAGHFYAAAGELPRRVVLRMRSPNRPKTMGVRCDSGLERRVGVDNDSTSIAIRVAPHSTQFCQVYLVRGGIDMVGRRQVSVEATLSLEPSALSGGQVTAG